MPEKRLARARAAGLPRRYQFGDARSRRRVAAHPCCKHHDVEFDPETDEVRCHGCARTWRSLEFATEVGAQEAVIGVRA